MGVSHFANQECDRAILRLASFRRETLQQRVDQHFLAETQQTPTSGGNHTGSGRLTATSKQHALHRASAERHAAAGGHAHRLHHAGAGEFTAAQQGGREARAAISPLLGPCRGDIAVSLVFTNW